VKPCSVVVERLPIDPKAIQDLRRQSLEPAPVSCNGCQDSSEFITTVFDDFDLNLKHEDLAEDPLHIPAPLAAASTSASRGSRTRSCNSDLVDPISSCELKKTMVKLASLADLLDADGSIKDEPDVIVCESDLSVISPAKSGSDPVSDPAEETSPCKRIRLDSSSNRIKPVLTSCPKTLSLNAA